MNKDIKVEIVNLFEIGDILMGKERFKGHYHSESIPNKGIVLSEESLQKIAQFIKDEFIKNDIGRSELLGESENIQWNRLKEMGVFNNFNQYTSAVSKINLSNIRVPKLNNLDMK